MYVLYTGLKNKGVGATKSTFRTIIMLSNKCLYIYIKQI